MENKELYKTLEELRTGQITTNIAMEQIFLLFDVVGRSEQLPTDIEVGKMISDLAKVVDDEMER